MSAAVTMEAVGTAVVEAPTHHRVMVAEVVGTAVVEVMEEEGFR